MKHTVTFSFTYQDINNYMWLNYRKLQTVLFSWTMHFYLQNMQDFIWLTLSTGLYVFSFKKIFQFIMTYKDESREDQWLKARKHVERSVVAQFKSLSRWLSDGLRKLRKVQSMQSVSEQRSEIEMSRIRRSCAHRSNAKLVVSFTISLQWCNNGMVTDIK